MGNYSTCQAVKANDNDHPGRTGTTDEKDFGRALWSLKMERRDQPELKWLTTYRHDSLRAGDVVVEDMMLFCGFTSYEFTSPPTSQWNSHWTAEISSDRLTNPQQLTEQQLPTWKLPVRFGNSAEAPGRLLQFTGGTLDLCSMEHYPPVRHCAQHGCRWIVSLPTSNRLLSREGQALRAACR